MYHLGPPRKRATHGTLQRGATQRGGIARGFLDAGSPAQLREQHLIVSAAQRERNRRGGLGALFSLLAGETCQGGAYDERPLDLTQARQVRKLVAQRRAQGATQLRRVIVGTSPIETREPGAAWALTSNELPASARPSVAMAVSAVRENRGRDMGLRCRWDLSRYQQAHDVAKFRLQGVSGAHLSPQGGSQNRRCEAS